MEFFKVTVAVIGFLMTVIIWVFPLYNKFEISTMDLVERSAYCATCFALSWVNIALTILTLQVISKTWG